MNRRVLVLGLAALSIAACAPKRIHEDPIMTNGDKVRAPDATTTVARETADRDYAAAAARRDSLSAAALSKCSPAVCDAIARGEVALGMSEDQVLAATRTTEATWSVRYAGPATVIVPRSTVDRPRDANGEIALVQLSNGQVARIGYNGPQGVRTVSSPADTTRAGRTRAVADALIREGDDLVARGDLNAALDRYDRADVLAQSDPMIEYRIASVLDKQLRPIEALIRYRLFLHRLELERIDAIGDAYAKQAEAIARAHERIIVLERQGR